MYMGSTREYVGAAVIIHVAEDFPEPDILVTTTQPEHQMNVVLTGSNIVSTDDIRKLSPAERNCVFQDEVSKNAFTFNVRNMEMFFFANCIGIIKTGKYQTIIIYCKIINHQCKTVNT